MTQRFKNKYRVCSVRLENYDYSSNGVYFITICTKNKEHFFGKIYDGKIELSEIGEMTKMCWEKITQHFSSVKLHEWVIMPNHVHGIIEINKINQTNVETSIYGVSNIKIDAISTERDAINRVSTMAGGITKNKNPMLHKNISTIIRWFKGRASFEIKKINPNFAWQARFYDRIVRNEKEFEKISQYLKHNPQEWEKDCYFDNSDL